MTIDLILTRSLKGVMSDLSFISVGLSDIVWPNTLPQSPLIDGYSFTRGETRHLTNMDTGPDKIRPKGEVGVQKVTYPIIINVSQKSDLRNFYRVTLRNGEKEFLIKLARETEFSMVRFLTPPRFSPITNVKWRSNLDLEVITD